MVARPEPLLVGRGRELALLQDAVEAAVARTAAVVLVSGEPGIGKTRLLDAVAADARRRGLTVLRGGSSEAAGMPPYLPFLEAIGGYLDAAPPDLLREQAGAGAPVLATIFPQLSLRLGELPAGYTLPAEQARLR